MTLRICMLSTSFPKNESDTSGKFVYDLARLLVTHQVCVVVVSPQDAQSIPRTMIKGVHICRFAYWWPRKWQTVIRGEEDLLDMLRSTWLAKVQLPIFLLVFMLQSIRISRQADIIHAHWSPTALIGWLAARLWNKPLVLTVHGSDLRLFPDWFSKFILNCVDAVIAPSAEMLNRVRQLGRADGHLIALPIDETRFCSDVDVRAVQTELGLDLSKPVVTFIARLHPFKDPLTLIKAIPLVLQHQDVSFLIVGDGPLRNRVQDAIQTLQVADHTYVLGSRQDVHKILKLSTLFIALSPVENVWSMTITEAMFMNIPCIMTRAGKTEFVFTHLRNAYLIEPENSQALADAIMNLLADAPLREKLVQGAHKLLAQYHRDSSSIVNQMIAVYRSVLR